MNTKNIKNKPQYRKSKVTLKQRVERIEAWIDQWETYDSGWTKYRSNNPTQTKEE